MKILIMTDSPFIPTGLGRVGREIAFKLLRAGHEIGYLGWYQHPDIEIKLPPGLRYWYTNNNDYGSDKLDNIVNKFQPDIVLTIGDIWCLNYIPGCKTRRWFQWCCYIPVDGEPLNGGLPPALVSTIEDIDIPVAYTNYAKEKKP